METRLASRCIGQRKRLRVGLDYRATEKADRSVHFECMRCFNGSLGKRRKIVDECFNEVSRSMFIRFIFSDAITRCCILREGNVYCFPSVQKRSRLCYLHYYMMLIRKDWAATCDHWKKIFVREFRFQILSRPVKMLYTGRLLLLPRISQERLLIANAHRPPDIIFSYRDFIAITDYSLHTRESRRYFLLRCTYFRKV